MGISEDRKAYTKLWRQTRRAKESRRAWHRLHYKPRPRVEKPDDPVVIAARVEAMRALKLERFSLTGRFSFPDQQARVVTLPGDERP